MVPAGSNEGSPACARGVRLSRSGGWLKWDGRQLYCARHEIICVHPGSGPAVQADDRSGPCPPLGRLAAWRSRLVILRRASLRRGAVFADAGGGAVWPLADQTLRIEQMFRPELVGRPLGARGKINLCHIVAPGKSATGNFSAKLACPAVDAYGCSPADGTIQGNRRPRSGDML
jgi:hypothetical protein